jgi:hypothetical protein
MAAKVGLHVEVQGDDARQLYRLQFDRADEQLAVRFGQRSFSRLVQQCRTIRTTSCSPSPRPSQENENEKRYLVSGPYAAKTYEFYASLERFLLDQQNHTLPNEVEKLSKDFPPE